MKKKNFLEKNKKLAHLLLEAIVSGELLSTMPDSKLVDAAYSTHACTFSHVLTTQLTVLFKPVSSCRDVACIYM